jgi:ribosomal protein S6--L-glutamate ligase
MKICIIGPKEMKDQERWLIEEAKKRFDKVTYAEIPDIRIHNNDVIYRNTNLANYDCVFPRVPRTYSSFGYIICKLLEGRTFMPIKPESIIITHNKFLTIMKLDRFQIPTPNSYLGFNTSVFNDVLDDVSYPIVIKLVAGSLGKGVMFAESKSTTMPLLDTIESMKQPIMLEEYIKNPGEDIRALVINGKVVASMRRIAKEGEKRANIGIGGTAKKIDLPYEMRILATSTARALGLGIGGIDIIEGKKGPLVIEANVNVHFEGITQATKLNIAGMMMEYVLKETEYFKKEGLSNTLSRVVNGLKK